MARHPFFARATTAPRLLLALLVAGALLAPPALAQGAPAAGAPPGSAVPGEERPRAARPARAAPRPAAPAPRREPNVVGVISGGVNGTYVRLAADLSSVLDDGERLRVLPILGKGSPQNLRDLKDLRGVDAAFVQSDILDLARATGGEAAARIAYVAKLYNEEMHVVARAEVGALADLAGRRVAVDVAGSGTEATAKAVFARLGLRIEPVNLDQAAALEAVKSGGVAAVVFIGGKPVRGIAELPAGAGLKLLAVPYAGPLAESYLPARLAPTDYPNLLGGGAVETVAVGTVLAVYDHPEGSERRERVGRFVEAFFGRFDEFLKPGRHPKWAEANLAAVVPGWRRFGPAQRWLDGARPAGAEAERAAFDRFVGARAPGASGDRERLFREFQEWQRANSVGRTNGAGPGPRP